MRPAASCIRCLGVCYFSPFAPPPSRKKKTTPSRAPGTARTIASPLFPPFSTTIRSGTPQVSHVARSPLPPLISAAVDTYRLLSHVVTTRLIRGLGAKLSEQGRTTLVFAVAAACIHLRPTLAPCNPHHLRNPSQRVVLAFFPHCADTIAPVWLRCPGCWQSQLPPTLRVLKGPSNKRSNSPTTTLRLTSPHKPPA